MSHAAALPKLLVDAQRANPTVVVVTSLTLTNARAVPYFERYRASTGLWETPIEHLQRVADEDAREPQVDQ